MFSLEEKLNETIELYITDPIDYSDPNFFKATREIKLARYALQKQAEFYSVAVEVYTELLRTAAANAPSNAESLRNIMVAINQIELKSQSLIDSIHRVTELIGKAVTIDIDKAALSHMVLRLPSLIKESISKVSDNPELAERISSNLDSKISELMLAFRFSQPSAIAEPSEQTPGISFEQYQNLFNSVPTQPIEAI